jgi:hypothetical protein
MALQAASHGALPERVYRVNPLLLTRIVPSEVFFVVDTRVAVVPPPPPPCAAVVGVADEDEHAAAIAPITSTPEMLNNARLHGR